MDLHRPEPAWRQDDVESCEEDLKSDGDEPERGTPEAPTEGGRLRERTAGSGGPPVWRGGKQRKGREGPAEAQESVGEWRVTKSWSRTKLDTCPHWEVRVSFTLLQNPPLRGNSESHTPQSTNQAMLHGQGSDTVHMEFQRGQAGVHAQRDMNIVWRN